jgi:hypothetical protein
MAEILEERLLFPMNPIDPVHYPTLVLTPGGMGPKIESALDFSPGAGAGC